MGLAGVFLAGTSFVLFNDIIFESARPTASHVLTALAMIAATAAGHLIVTTFRAHRFFNGIGMVLLTAAALAYVATMSGARNAEQSGAKAERIDGSNKARAEIITERASAQRMLDQARSDIARECASGEGTRCKGRRATEAVYSAAVAGHDARLAALPAQQTPNAGYKAAAEAIVMTGMTARTAAEVEKALIVLLPWLAVLIAELGVIVFLSYALGHKEIDDRKKTTTSVPSFSDTSQSSFSTDGAADVRAMISGPLPEPTDNDGPIPPLPPKGRRTRKTTERAIDRKTTTTTNVVAFPARHPVIAALENVGRPVSNEELKALMGCSSSEASKRWREVRDLLDVGQNGRHLAIGLKAWTAKATA